MTTVIFVLVAFSVLMPAYYIVRLLRLDAESKSACLMVAIEGMTFVALTALVARWDIAGYHVRTVIIVGFLVALACSFRAHASRPWSHPGGLLRRQKPTLVALILFLAALAYVLTGVSPPAGTRQLALPVDAERVIAGQAGRIAVLNHHADHKQQAYAIDFTALSRLGFRADGVLPKALESYTIFGAPVISPCDGKVVAATDGLPDLVPPQRSPEVPAGNHVILACGDLQVELAHFMQGSVRIEAGDRVSVGDQIGLVGNSGNTTEPHLHIHAINPKTNVAVCSVLTRRNSASQTAS